MQISFCNSNDKSYQKKLNKLLKPIFLDFEFWYDLNLWDSNYESYSIMKNDELVSNICLYKSKLNFKGEVYDCLSVGAVATAHEHRGKGFSRLLMEHIINKYPSTPMYLSANESVLDFYPRFGFKQVYEKLPVTDIIIDNPKQPVRLKYDDPKVWQYVTNRTEFSKQLGCLNTESINLFHIHSGYLNDCLYELPEIQTLVVAEKKGQTLKLTAVFSRYPLSLLVLKDHLPFREINRIEFGFTPDSLCSSYRFEPYVTDPIFVKNIKCNLGDFKFPELSIT